MIIEKAIIKNKHKKIKQGSIYETCQCPCCGKIYLKPKIMCFGTKI